MTRPRSRYVYPPFEARSRDRRWRLVVSPAPARGLVDHLRGARSAMVVYETEHGHRDAREVRRWEATRAGASARAGFVRDDGGFAVLFADDAPVFVRPGGEVEGRANVLDVIRADPGLAPHLTHSTAGPSWTELPLGDFVDTDHGPRLCLRPDHGAGRAAEARWVVDSLHDALPHRDGARAGALARVAGQDGIRDAAPAILALEADAQAAEQHVGNAVWSAARSVARSRAQTALVRLDVDFAPGNAYGPLARARFASWREALASLRPGMRAEEIVAVAGAPFFDGYANDEAVWEYDLRRAGRYETLRLRFDGDRLRDVGAVGDAYRGTHRDG